MRLNQIDFNNAKKEWTSEKFLREFFQVKKNENPFNKYYIKEFIDTISNIPLRHEYTMVGYGSLLNEKDIPRTLPSGKNHRLGILNGYKRIFNVAGNVNDIAYLNVEKVPYDLQTYVALIDFPYYELPNIIARESLYDFTEVMIQEQNKETQSLMVVGNNYFVNNYATPLLNYLHLCISGIKDLAGKEGVDNFLYTTYCYSQYHGEQVTINEYLKHVNLLDYMVRREYISR